MGNPLEFARKAINSFKQIPHWFEASFNELFKKTELKFVLLDIARENKNKKQREKRMSRMEQDIKAHQEEAKSQSSNNEKPLNDMSKNIKEEEKSLKIVTIKSLRNEEESKHKEYSQNEEEYSLK